MLSSVYLTGRLGPCLGPTLRLVEIEGILPSAKGTFDVTEVRVRCDRGESAYFMRAKLGSLVVVKGRLESDEQGHLLVVNEIDEVFGSATLMPSKDR